MAFAATKRVGNSVCRHRAIRKLREFYRLNKAAFPEGAQILILLRAPVADWPGLEARLTRLLSELPQDNNLGSGLRPAAPGVGKDSNGTEPVA